MASREVADIQERPRVADERVRLALRDEPIGDAALVEHLERAGVEPPGPPSVELLVGPTLDDEDIDPRQRQFGRQHQPGRSPSRDHHLMLSHRRSPAFANTHSTLLGSSFRTLVGLIKPAMVSTYCHRRSPGRREGS